MGKSDRSTTRRRFIGYGVLGTAAAGLAAAAGLLAGRGRGGATVTGRRTGELGDRFQYDISELA